MIIARSDYIWEALIKWQMIIDGNSKKFDVADKWHSWSSDTQACSGVERLYLVTVARDQGLRFRRI
jgi:hypothetical protein